MMKRYWPLLLLLPSLLTDCGGSTPAPAPTVWFLNYNVGGSIKQAAGGFTVMFPAANNKCPEASGIPSVCPQIDYVVHAGKFAHSVTISGTITGGPFSANTQTGNDNGNPTCRPWFQRAFDNLTQAYYRWWSNPVSIPMKAGSFSITVALDPAEWSSVFGEVGNNSAAATNGFNQAVANMANYGMTCGGTFFGHGINGTGTMTATYTVN